PHMLEDLFHQGAEPGRARQVRAVAGEIDAGEHDLAVAARAQRPHLRDHLAHRHRARVAAAERNNAEGAAMVAAVLHLHEGTGAAVNPVAEVRAGLLHRHDVVDRDFLFGGDAKRTAAEHLALVSPDLAAELLLVAQHQGNLGHDGEGFRLRLRGAAGHHDARIGPLALEFADRLARLPHRLGSDRAGIHHHGVGDAGGRRRAADHLGLVGVEAAAEGDDVDAHGAPALDTSALAVSAGTKRTGSNVPAYSYCTGPVISTWSSRSRHSMPRSPP